MDHDFRNGATPATNDDGYLPVKRNRSLRRLFPAKHGVSPSPTSSSSSSPTSTLPPRLPSAPRSQPPISYNDRNRVAHQHPHSQRSASNDSYHSRTGPAPHLHNIRPVPSEAARLRSLNSGQQSPINSEPRSRQDIPPQLENFSRPRKISLKSGEEPPRPPLNPSSTFPLQNHSEAPSYTPRPELARERGFSASSSLSNTFAPSRPLRNSISIPNLIPADRQRDVSNNSPTSRNRMVYGSRDDSLSSHYREPIIRPNPVDEEVRESFRSVQTTGTTGTGTTWKTGTTATTWTASSFLDASGTERSSVLSKSSSATSINGRDQIDDFLDMYEDGFASETEEEILPEPPTIPSFQAENSGQTRVPEPAIPEPASNNNNDDLQVPQFPNLIIRDSAEIFRVCKPYADPFHEGADTARGSSATQPYQHSQPPPTGLSRGLSRRNQAQTPSSLFDNTRDRYGFKKKSQHVSLPDYEAWSAQYADHVARRRRKWIRLMQECGLDAQNPTAFPPRSSKTKRFIRKGIPPDWRGEAWFWYAGGPAILAQHRGLYAELVSRAANGRVSATDEELIERDLNRTFPDNILFKPDAVPVPAGADSNAGSVSAEAETPMLQSLRRVLQATSIHNPKIGYCQSLNFLAGLLLLFLDEERAFWMLDIITKTYLPGTHEVSLEGANVDLGVLMSCIREAMPGVWAKIGGELDGTGAEEERRGAAPTMRLPPITLCCTAWFMSCFIGTLPIETTLRVWDAFFYEGSKTLFRIALAVFKVGEAEIRAVSDPMEIFQVVQTIPRRLVDANALMGACFRRRNGFGHLSQETIEERRRERRRGYADEREGRRPQSKRGNVFATMRGRR